VRESREKWVVVTGAPLEGHWTEERSNGEPFVHASEVASQLPHRYVPGAAGRSVSRWMWKPHWSGCISTKRLVCLGVIGAPTAVVNMSVLDAHSRTRFFVGLKFGDVILRVVTRAISTCQ
jgi:hypothetical protein